MHYKFKEFHEKKKSEKSFWNKACKNVTTGRTQYLTD